MNKARNGMSLLITALIFATAFQVEAEKESEISNNIAEMQTVENDDKNNVKS